MIMFKKIILFLVALLAGFFIFQFAPVSGNGEEVRFVVNLEEKDQPAILDKLINEKLIKNKTYFSLLSIFYKIPPKIEPGAYLLRRNMWLWQTADILQNKPYQKWSVLRPGLRKEQVAGILSKDFKWNQTTEKDFIEQAEEGYLFPDTYLFNVDGKAADFIAKISNNFNEKFDAQLQADLLTQDIRNDTAIKIASLIERESGSLEDKAIIAGVIWNRLSEGMRLQIDATSQYILGEKGNWWPRVKPADHKSESTYNTYLIPGLPPGPISSPSLDSIKAVVYPAQTDCLYYIHDRNKTIHCSETYEEHLENVEKYLK